MNGEELIKRMAKRSGLPQRSCRLAIRAAFRIIKEEGHLEYRGFGVFRTRVTGVKTFTLGWSGERGISLGKKKLVFDESKPRRKQ